METESNQILQACLAVDPFNDLRKLVYSFSSQGFSRQNIYNIFLEYLRNNQESEEWLQVASKFNSDHPVEIILDCLGGFCQPHQVLLPNEPFTPQ